MSNHADDVHAQLARALELATPKNTPATHGLSVGSTDILAALVQPLALASIALELRELRITIQNDGLSIFASNSLTDAIGYGVQHGIQQAQRAR